MLASRLRPGPLTDAGAGRSGASLVLARRRRLSGGGAGEVGVGPVGMPDPDEVQHGVQADLDGPSLLMLTGPRKPLALTREAMIG